MSDKSVDIIGFEKGQFEFTIGEHRPDVMFVRVFEDSISYENSGTVIGTKLTLEEWDEIDKKVRDLFECGQEHADEKETTSPANSGS